uniref:Uncharacterized protein n=1 Tax=Amphimedon queenslandica TaxID=400682 RepID=A0A1X7TTE6_AMPQE
MKSDLMEQNERVCQIISQSYFYKLWGSELRNVIIPERSMFNKYDTCTKVANECHKSVNLVRSAYEEQYKRHSTSFSIDKKGKNILFTDKKTRSSPEKYVTIIIDGMDQSKTNMPCLCRD